MPDNSDWGLLRVSQSNKYDVTKVSHDTIRPDQDLAYGVAVAEMAGWPSNTITRSARYVAMIKSCSITNAVFLA